MDKRVIYTKKAIREVFLELLEKKGIEKVTVREICSKAKINRTTFYKYYDNPYDLMEKLEKEVLDELVEKIKENKTTNFIDTLRITLTGIKENEATYKLVFKTCDDGEFRNRLFSLCYDENIKTIDEIFKDDTEEEKEWIYNFIAEGCNGVLKKWFSSGMEAPVEEVVQFICRLVDGINSTGK